MAPTEPEQGLVRVADALRRTGRDLAGAGIEGAGRDARRLVAAVLGVNEARLILEPDRVLNEAECNRLAEMTERRARHEPVSRILGEREFYGRSFKVTRDTLDPRADTETLIEAVLEIVDREGGRDRPLRIIDVGSGTGCILLTLLAELPRASGVATDISAAALAVARENAGRLGLLDRAAFEIRDGLEPPCDRFDILVSNPPYIETGHIAGLAPDVRDYDPRLALDGGPDGLVMYRRLASQLRHVVQQGWAFFEVGAGQAPAVAELMVERTGSDARCKRVWRDIDGHDRCVAIWLHQ